MSRCGKQHSRLGQERWWFLSNGLDRDDHRVQVIGHVGVRLEGSKGSVACSKGKAGHVDGRVKWKCETEPVVIAL